MNGSSISEQLPEPILHKILSLLSQKEAVRTSVLSKSWRHLWYARPVINFRRSDFVCKCSSPKTPNCGRCLPENRNTFRSALDKTFQIYHSQKLSIEIIDLDMFENDHRLKLLLLEWIPILIVPDMPSLKTFSLCFSPHSSTTNNFNLPWVVFQVKSLKKLCLQRCNVVVNPNKVLLGCSLQILSLDDVFIEVHTLEMLMSSCPLIENVVLKQCEGLEMIRIKHNNLKHFSFSSACDDIHSPGSSIDIIDAPNLVSLSLEDVQLHTNSLENLLSKLPRLERLSLIWCKCDGELKLSSRSIKHLGLSVESIKFKASIDMPNLSEFKYVGGFHKASLAFAPTSSKWKAQVDLDFLEDYHKEEEEDSPWFENLGELLRALSNKSRIHVEAGYDSLPPKQQHVEQGGGGLNDDELVVVQNVRLFYSKNYSLQSLPHFLNGLFSVCRPMYTQTLCNQKEIFDFLWKVLVLEREKRDYFWQKDLEQVEIEVWDEEAYQWKPISLPECSSELPSEVQNVIFRLKWRSVGDS